MIELLNYVQKNLYDEENIVQFSGFQNEPIFSDNESIVQSVKKRPRASVMVASNFSEQKKPNKKEKRISEMNNSLGNIEKISN